MLFSCSEEQTVDDRNPESLITHRSDSLTLIVSENGLKQYRFETPLMERYQMAREPYMEFRYGIKITTYRDSTEAVASTLVADYAIYYENRELWEARGNVVGEGEDGRTLYTQQLFWDQKTKKVYSNVDSKVIQGDDVFIGEGFESDESFDNWLFRNYTGKIAVDVAPSDSTQVAAPDSLATAGYTPPESTSEKATDNPTPLAPTGNVKKPEPISRDRAKGRRE